MRHPSIFFALLLAPLTLPAQTPAVQTAPAGGSTTQTERQRQVLDQLERQVEQMRAAELSKASTCPVGLSVNRVASGAVIWTNSESDWFNAHSTLSLPELEQALKIEPGFRSLSPEDQQHRLDQLAQLYHMRHGQGLDIAFFQRAPRIAGAPAGTGQNASQIVSAEITVRGYPPTTRIIPATPSLPGEVAETFHLTASAGAPLFRSSVWTEHMVIINSVELTRVTYANGTTWESSAPRQCAASPSLYVPVAASAR